MRPTRPFILLLLLAVLIPGADTLRAARPYRPGFLYREGPRLMLDGKPYRSASFNACQFSGCGHPYELFPDREIDSLMATLPPGMLIRTWAFPGSEDRTARLLQMADRHGHKLLLTLGDGRSSCGHHDGARDGDGSGKCPEWYADGYRREYLPHVRRMVEKFKDARGVGMWEILNEAGDADWRVIKRFYDTVAAEIKRIDPDHLVSTGSWAPWAYGGLEHFRELHAGPSIDVGCVHEYDYDFQEQNTIASPHVDVALQALHGLDKVAHRRGNRHRERGQLPHQPETPRRGHAPKDGHLLQKRRRGRAHLEPGARGQGLCAQLLARRPHDGAGAPLSGQPPLKTPSVAPPAPGMGRTGRRTTGNTLFIKEKDSAETLLPPAEALHAIRAEALQTVAHLVDSAFAVEVRFREELVGIADHLLLERLGSVVARRQGQSLPRNGRGGQAGAGVTLAYAGDVGQPLAAHELRPQVAVHQVGLGAVAVDAGCVGKEDAHVVQQGGVVEEGAVERQFGMAFGHVEGFARHALAVCEQDAAQLVVLGVILADKA